MRKLILIMTLLLLVGCKTKKVSKSSESSKEVQKTENKKDSTSQKSSVQEKDSVTKTEKKERIKDQETEITVKGKVDKDNPLELHDIKNGDTLQSIRITGNADVVIKSKNKTSENSKKESKSETISDKIKEFSQNIVDENNISERASYVKNKVKDLQVTDTSTGVYITVIILGVVAIVMLFFFIYFKKN